MRKHLTFVYLCLLITWTEPLLLSANSASHCLSPRSLIGRYGKPSAGDVSVLVVALSLTLYALSGHLKTQEHSSSALDSPPFSLPESVSNVFSRELSSDEFNELSPWIQPLLSRSFSYEEYLHLNSSNELYALFSEALRLAYSLDPLAAQTTFSQFRILVAPLSCQVFQPQGTRYIVIGEDFLSSIKEVQDPFYTSAILLLLLAHESFHIAYPVRIDAEKMPLQTKALWERKAYVETLQWALRIQNRYPKKDNSSVDFNRFLIHHIRDINYTGAIARLVTGFDPSGNQEDLSEFFIRSGEIARRLGAQEEEIQYEKLTRIRGLLVITCFYEGKQHEIVFQSPFSEKPSFKTGRQERSSV